MKNEKDIADYIKKISERETLKLKENFKNSDQVHDYLFKTSVKIFKKLVFPYFRFEILFNCITDIKNNSKHYPKIKRIDEILNKLQKICLYMTVALDEYYNMLSCIEKYPKTK